MAESGHIVVDSGDDYIKLDDKAKKFLGHSFGAYGFVLLLPEDTQDQFVFKLNPQSIEQDEEASVNIIPTQGGGKYVENQGCLFKDIVISGTTGFLSYSNAYNDGASQYLTDTGQAQASRDAVETGLSTVSGYLEFHKLRGLFRKYWSIHRNKDKAYRDATKLLFCNAKDDEVWLVEPMSFKMPRNSKSPMTYPYSIRLRALAKYDETFLAQDYIPFASPTEDGSTDPDTATDQLNKANSSLSAESAAIKQFKTPDKNKTSVFDLALGGLRSAVGAVNTAGAEAFVYLDDITSVLDEATRGITDLVGGVSTVLSVPRKALDEACTAVDDVFTVAESAGVSLPTGLMYTLIGVKQDLYYLMSRPELFKESADNKWKSAISSYQKSFGPDGSVDGNAVSYKGLASTTVRPGETPWSMASRIFGDPSVGYTIIAINNLSYPYFTSASNIRLPGTLGSGDPVFVPSVSARPVSDSGVATASSVEQGYVAVSGSTSVSKSYDGLVPVTGSAWISGYWVGYVIEIMDGNGAGQVRTVTANDSFSVTVDEAWDIVPGAGSMFKMYMTSSPAKSFDHYFGTDLCLSADKDLSLSASRDLAVVSGFDNYSQALSIKLSTEQRTLALHTWFGMGITVGEKASAINVLVFKLNCERTLRSDPRTESVKNLKVTVNRDTLRLSAEVFPRFGSASVKLTKIF